MRKHHRAPISAAWVALTALACQANPAQAAGLFDQNLIVNGDAESGPGSNSGSTVASVPGFGTVGGFTVTTYGAGGGFPTLTDAGPADRGLNFFSGGPSNSNSLAEQRVDVSGASALIDQGSVGFDLSAYLGGFSSQRDNATLQISFLDAGVTMLDLAAIGPVSASDRGNLTGLLLRSTTGTVPVGTRFIDVMLTMTRLDGSYNDGYADNLSLVLAAVPEPSSYALMLAGIGALTVRARRRRSCA